MIAESIIGKTILLLQLNILMLARTRAGAEPLAVSVNIGQYDEEPGSFIMRKQKI